MRRLPALVSAALVAAGLNAVPALATRPAAPTGAPQAPEVLHTGLLPSFTATGSNLIRLQAGAFDPLADAAPTIADVDLVDEATLDPAIAQPWLVQVRDGRFADARLAIADAGATVLGNLLDDTYAVRATPAQAAALATSDAVRWAGYLQPAWRIPVAAGEKPGLLDLEGAQSYRVHGFRGDTPGESLADALRGIDGVEVLDDAGVVVDVRATKAQVPAIAALPQVQWIGTVPVAVPHNANARWVTDTGVRDLYAATADGRLTGEGQTAAAADSGLNYTTDDNGHAHASFRDCDAYPEGCELADYTMTAPGDTEALMTDVVENATDHRKMAAFFDLGGAGPNPQDPTAHGTHVSGSIAGDRGENGTWDGEDGLAPGARFVFQSIGDATGGLGGLPMDDYQLWRQAYRPRDPASVEVGHDPADYADYVALEDARTHNNSYGLIVNTVDDATAAALDQFVWDHEDMVVVVSAGNEGPQPLTIGSPSTAKNDLSSGASANGRQPMASIDSMAIFSSHGPTGDGRLGVDLATPGQTVISTKGGSEHDDHYLQGTSMSAPVLTGLATLVREYFFDGYGPGGGDGMAAGDTSLDRRHNPSAAMVRAALVNGAVRMKGWYTGDDGSQREMDGQWPSYGQGFGLVNLDNSLFFTGDTMANWYQDVWRDDGEAFQIGDIGATRTYEVDVQPGQPLDVTLSYTDAPNLLPAGTSALVNNLDLMVTGPSGTFVGNNFNSRQDGTVDEATSNAGPLPVDTVNPTERVRIADPEPGTYTITVQAGLVTDGPQGFALAASGLLSDVADAGSFDPGPSLQVDAPGDPTIDPASIEVDTFSADTAEIRFRTDEPTTARAVLTVEGTEVTFSDVYNYPDDSPFTAHYRTGPVETSAGYADRPVVSTQHEILVFGLSPGDSYDVELLVEDLADPPDTDTASTTIDSPNNAYQPYADDIGMLAQADTDVIPSDVAGGAGWQTATQLYIGQAGGVGDLGAFMFRLPSGLDPSTITGAAVELVGMHVSSSLYNADQRTYVDLLPEDYEPSWGTQNYDEIHNAPSEARALPETAVRLGGGTRHAFTFPCDGLAALRSTLETQDEDTGERAAAFRVDAEVLTENDSTPSFEFGFNRRTRGPELRPRLVLFTDEDDTNLTRPCDDDAPAPEISEVGMAPALEDDAVTVSWRTDRPGDSLVMFREVGEDEWTQVGTPMLTTSHHVQVRGLDARKEYQLAVRSTGCNGAATTDDNGGTGYEPFLEQGRPAVVATEFEELASWDFNDGEQGWTVVDEGAGAGGSGLLTSNWAHDPSGGPEGDGAMAVMPYTPENRTILTAPEAVTVGDGEVELSFDAYVDTEPDFDYLIAEYSVGDGPFVEAARYSGNEAAWLERTLPLDVDAGDEVLVRFLLTSDSNNDSTTGAGEGVAVDNVVLRAGLNARPELPADEMHTVPPHHAPPAEGDAFDAADVPTRSTPTSADLAAGTGYCPDGVPEGVFATATDVLEGDDGETPLTFTVHLPAGTEEPLTVHYETVAGTATAGDDFVPQSGDLTFEAGDTKRPVVVPVVGDDLAENDETVLLRLTAPEGTPVPQPEVTATVLDDDGRGASCPPGRVPASGLDDIEGNTHEASIECIAWYGITLGLGDTDGDGEVEYGPDGDVTRGQMASFIARLGLEAGLDLPDDAPNAFDDDDGTQHEANIDALAALQLVRGRPDTTDVDDDGDREELQFFPDEPVSRAQMASFIARLHEAAHEPFPTPTESHFPDDDGNEHEGNIDRLAEAGVVQGRPAANGELRYFPDEAVSRAQMASFIARELGLLVKAGVIPAGGADVVLDDNEVGGGDSVTGRVVTAPTKELLGLQVGGCGIDAEDVDVEDDDTFAVTVPQSRPPGPCTLVFTATTQRRSPLEPDPPAQTVDVEVPITVT